MSTSIACRHGRCSAGDGGGWAGFAEQAHHGAQQLVNVEWLGHDGDRVQTTQAVRVLVELNGGRRAQNDWNRARCRLGSQRVKDCPAGLLSAHQQIE
jgi:hypothetical protein